MSCGPLRSGLTALTGGGVTDASSMTGDWGFDTTSGVFTAKMSSTSALMSIGEGYGGEPGLFSRFTDTEWDSDMEVVNVSVKGPLQYEPVGVPRRGGGVAATNKHK